jgi:hypothetical protein
MKATSEEPRKRERARWTTASQANGVTRKQLRTTTQRLERTAWWPRQCRRPGYRMTTRPHRRSGSERSPGNRAANGSAATGEAPRTHTSRGLVLFALTALSFRSVPLHHGTPEIGPLDPQHVDSTARPDQFLWMIKKVLKNPCALISGPTTNSPRPRRRSSEGGNFNGAKAARTRRTDTGEPTNGATQTDCERRRRGTHAP